jgi:hypothetical protein
MMATTICQMCHPWCEVRRDAENEIWVARWYICIPKIQICMYIFWRGGVEWKMSVYDMAICNIWLPFGTFCGNLVHFAAIWYILWQFGTFCGNLVHFVVILYIFHILECCTKKNLATLGHEIRKTACHPTGTSMTLGRRGRRGCDWFLSSFFFGRLFTFCLEGLFLSATFVRSLFSLASKFWSSRVS